METLSKKRATIKGFLTRIEAFVSNFEADKVTEYDFQFRLEKLDEIFTNFDSIQSQIEDLIKEDEHEAQNKVREDFECKYFRVKTLLKNLFDKYRETSEFGDKGNESIRDSKELEGMVKALVSNQVVLNNIVSKLSEPSEASLPNTSINHQVAEEYSSTSNIKFPRIDLPRFVGDYRDWMPFKDLFLPLIHENQKLTLVEKFQYLKTSLHGDAGSLIKHFTVTEANYVEAWTHLTERYDRKRYIVEAYLKTFSSVPSLNNPSSSDLKKFYNTITESVRALRALDLPIDHWDSWLVFTITTKLDPETKQLWARSTTDIDLPSYKELTKFLEGRLTELECCYNSRSSTSRFQFNQGNKPSTQANTRAAYVSTMDPKGVECLKCTGRHRLFQCEAFINLPIHQRKTFVQGKSLCINCFSPTHAVLDCKRGVCRYCGKKHNSLLHQTSTAVATTSSANKFQTKLSNSAVIPDDSLLPTAVVLIRDSRGQMQSCRALLDSGSSVTLLKDSLVQRLGIKKTHAKVVISGIGLSNSQVTRGKVTLTLHSQYSCENIKISALVLNELTKNLPVNEIHLENREQFELFNLADPYYFIPSPIDIIIGSDVMFEILENERYVGTAGSPVAQKTLFGWVLAGKYSERDGLIANPTSLCTCEVSDDLDQQLQRFWNLEELQTSGNGYTPEEQLCMQHYEETHRRHPTGSYEVQLPFKPDVPELGNSRKAAYRRLCAMERRFQRDPELQREYSEFMKEYLILGHMSLLTEADKELPSAQYYYLPHHAVRRDESQTTKLRVVFDASQSTDNGRSLNDNLMVGPSLQADLIAILIRFRTHKIAFAADIAKMFRQVQMNQRDVNYQRIMWRFSLSEPISEYNLLTVTYGTASAPFLATRTLKHLAEDERSLYPEAAKILANDFYVDDCISGSDSLLEAKKVTKELNNLLQSGGFHLRKWKSNSKELLEYLSEELDNENETFQLVSDEITKTLGIYWRTTDDQFLYKFQLLTTETILTKSTLLSHIAKSYDPMGWVAPSIIKAKILMQKLWIAGVKWDENIPTTLEAECLDIVQDMSELEEVEIPRWIGPARNIELFAFADASELAYGAVVYKREFINGKAMINIIMAKSKVAPIKQISLPKLELCGAYLLAKLVKFIKSSFQTSHIKCYAYTDSQIVLGWLAHHPRRWSSFVANRTSYIQEELPSGCWNHVTSSKNPADLLTRGLSPRQLVSSELWWRGPNFLQDPNLQPPIPCRIMAPENLPDFRNSFCFNVTVEDGASILHQFSSYSKLIRVVAYIKRFSKNCSLKQKGLSSQTGYLTTNELNEAMETCVRIAQHDSFLEEIKLVHNDYQLPKRSPLKSVNVFVDKKGILRVGGRLNAADMSYQQKHPIVLHKTHHLTRIITRHLHLLYMHAGPRLLFSVVNQTYWIVGCHNLIRGIVLKCVTCTRHRASSMIQQMSALPRARVQPGRPFSNIGVDYGGPITLKTWKGRGAKLMKGYICLFVCLATKAMEAVSELSSQAFLAAFRRFIARRGYCTAIWSDNGTNFVGANRELKETLNFIRSSDNQDSIANELSNKGIQWNFIPPSAPHFGGLWEAGIKSVKHHLKRTIGEAKLTFEEFANRIVPN